tara:strand:- start:641 stop:1204 length:564 start_codon:yes stop_codon:yes gene_type:complete
MIINPPNTYWLQEKIPTEMHTYVQSQIDKANIDKKKLLAGHISKSLGLPDEMNVFKSYLFEKAKELKYANLTGNLCDLWVNFQKKYEYNPSHTHTGQISFVLWMKIPYKQEDEKKLEIVPNNHATPCLNGSFEISYTDILGQLIRYSMLLDKKDEGTMLMFPSNTQHCVYPFYTSDEERISISGNLA